jgi:hypothetical protein
VSARALDVLLSSLRVRLTECGGGGEAARRRGGEEYFPNENRDFGLAWALAARSSAFCCSSRARDSTCSPATLILAKHFAQSNWNAWPGQHRAVTQRHRIIAAGHSLGRLGE